MKFSKEELLNKAKAELGKNGKSISMSDKTLQGQIETLYALGVTEETELDDFVKKILPSLENLEGQYRHDNATFVEQWKKDHADPSPQPTLQPKPDGSGDSRLDEALKMISEMKAEREAEKKALAVAQKRQELLSSFKKEGITDDAWASKYVADLAIDENTDIEARTKVAKELFNGARAKGSSYTPSAGGNGADDGAEQRKSLFEAAKNYL